MEKYLIGKEVKDLIIRAKSGDDEAWGNLYHNFENYVHDRAWGHMRKFGVSEARKKDVEEELYQAGWQGFLDSLRSYDPEKGEFLTYATSYIDGEISKAMDFVLNSMGLTERPKLVKGQDMGKGLMRVSLDSDSGYAVSQMAETIYAPGSGLSVKEAPDRGKYSAERRVLQIMEVLRLLTDEEHSLSKEELGRMLCIYRTAKYDNGTPLESPNTLTSTIENMLMEVDPLEYTDENDKNYKIKYEGYKENRLKAKQNRENGKKAADITGFSYVHMFDNGELDRLIQTVCFSDILSNQDKQRLVDKLVSTASVYYRTPFWDGKGLRFNPKAVHGRFSGRILQDKRQFAENVNLVQQAVNNLGQIRFKFNRYTVEHTIIPKSEHLHILSPYHLVVYHDNYYCIGLKKEDKRIWHYRVDLMSDVEIIRDEEGRIVPIEVGSFDGLPICNAYWDPEKYMAEHLNMAYDEPQDIRIKIRNTDHTILHDWFGNHYEKSEQPCEEGYDIVIVKTSPHMIVHWAMQYAGAVEMMDEEIREKIREEMRLMEEKYGKPQDNI